MAEKIIGKIVNTFGIKGQLKVSISTFNPDDRFALGKKITIKGDKDIEATINYYRLKDPKIAIIGIKGYSDINEVEEFIGNEITQDVEAPEGTYFYDDLIGLVLVGPKGDEYGKVETVINMRAGDYLVSQNRYIPFKEGLFIEKVSLEEGKIYLTDLGVEVL